MNYLLVGRSGVLETVIAALVLLDGAKVSREEINEVEVLADINRDKKGEPIFIKADQAGNKVYTLGISNYKLISKISTELARVAGQEKPNLTVITIEIKGDNITYYLSRLGTLPVVGSLFLNLAKQRLLSRRPQIIKACKDIVYHRFPTNIMLVSAKPIREN